MGAPSAKKLKAVIPSTLNSHKMPEETRTVTIQEYMEIIADSVSEEFLAKEVARHKGRNDPHSVTDKQLREHGIDACAVTYADNDFICTNPASWAGTEYSISDVFHKGDIKFKVFVGESD